MRKPTPLHIVIARLKPLGLHHQIAHLQALISFEKPYSVRCNELTSLLQGKMTRQLRRESRSAA